MLSGSMLQETRHSGAEVEVCAYEGAEDAREGTAGATIQDHQAPPMRRAYVSQSQRLGFCLRVHETRVRLIWGSENCNRVTRSFTEHTHAQHACPVSC
jgi:hypothetical protein